MRDDLGVLRRDFPHAMYCVAGTQVNLDLGLRGSFLAEFPFSWHGSSAFLHVEPISGSHHRSYSGIHWFYGFSQADQPGSNSIAVVHMTNVTGKIPKAPSAMEDGDDDADDSDSSSDEEDIEDLEGAPNQPIQSKKPIFKVCQLHEIVFDELRI